MLSQRFSLRISPELDRRIRHQARMVRRRPAVVMREILERGFAEKGLEPSCYDLAREAGMIGGVTDVPSDLSRNRLHFEGFGRRSRSA